MEMFYVLLLLLVLINFVRSSSTEQKSYGSFVNASSIEQLYGDMQSVRPLPIDCAKLASCQFNLSPASALGSNGPLSAYGPLGILGPIGHYAWNPSPWILTSNNIVD